MKHLINKVHHPHLKKRLILEIVGLAVLMAFIILQRDILRDSLATVLEVEILWFAMLISMYWILLPLTAISYKYISPKPDKIKISTTMLAHLAGAGPGRIIPGGIGNLSISAMHLKKTGLSIEQALGVVITNNIFGLLSNVILLIGVLTLRPQTTRLITDTISLSQIVIAVGVFLGLIVIIQWLLHIRGAREEINKTARQWKRVFKQFIVHPRRVVIVLAIGAIIAIIQSFMLDFSAFALDIHLSITSALIAMSFGVVVGGLLPTPGGVGGVEAGITGALIVLGLSATEATSIAVLFRVATYWQPLLPGTISYLYLRERKLL